MANTAGNLGTTWGWNLGENNWKAAHDKNLRALDALTQAHIIERVLTTPPASPADGDCYIPATGATGAWSGHANDFARWNAVSSSWEFWTPRKGWEVYNESDGYSYRWNGTAWEGCNFSYTQLNNTYLMRSGETGGISTTSYVNGSEIRTSNATRITTGGIGQFTGLTSTGGGTFTGGVLACRNITAVSSGGYITSVEESGYAAGAYFSYFQSDVGNPDGAHKFRVRMASVPALSNGLVIVPEGFGGSYSYGIGTKDSVPVNVWIGGARVAQISSAGGLGFFNQAAPTVRPTINAACTDLATAVALLNQIRTNVIACGMMQ